MSTADAIRNKLATGKATGGKFHMDKGKQYASALKKVLKEPGLSGNDKGIAQVLLDDLLLAISVS